MAEHQNPTEPQEPAKPQKPWILDLPNELLTEILELYAASLEPTMPVIFTCRRFYQVGLPIHHQRLKLSSSELSPLKDRMKVLERRLQEGPTLGPYCRDLCIYSNDTEETDTDSSDRVDSGSDDSYLDDNFWPNSGSNDIDLTYNPDNFPFLRNIASHLPKVNSLEIDGCLEIDGESYCPKNKDTWNLFRFCVASMPSLRTVSLRRHFSGELEVHKVLDALKGTSVRRLTLNGDASSNSSIEELTSRYSLIRIKDFGPSCITELILKMHDERPEATGCLLGNWPQPLTRLTIKNSYLKSTYMDLPMLGPMLEKHKDTLVKLSIDTLSSEEGRGKLCDFSAFRALEELELAMYQIVAHWPAEFGEKEYGLLLPPNLSVFKLIITGICKDNYDHFDDQAGSWLRGFAKAAVRQKIPLRKIAIDVPVLLGKRNKMNSFLVWHKEDAPEIDIFWDRIEALEKDLGSMGIKVTY
ncbi:unnamed protein product [Clonostachys solani]|uniref:Uncharacterized protein n=1 Tax=Clonostachys solani TaxID=160281 RepID=A0A9N9W946_9HYPO|nr:unnamed protein product [Clonostachys solani]